MVVTVIACPLPRIEHTPVDGAQMTIAGWFCGKGSVPPTARPGTGACAKEADGTEEADGAGAPAGAGAMPTCRGASTPTATPAATTTTIPPAIRQLFGKGGRGPCSGSRP